MGEPDPRTLDFSSNVSPLGPPAAVRRYLKGHLDMLDTYPDPDSGHLRADLQRYTGVDSRCIIAGNGATELIYNFCQAFVRTGMPVLIPVPAFGEYEAAARLHGARVRFLRTSDLESDLGRLLQRIPERGCVFLCNPNNPTGALLPGRSVAEIIRTAAARSTLVFVDECFIELVPRSDESVLGLVPECGNLCVLRSLTKSFGLAGARIGYALGPRDMMRTMGRIKIPWSVSGIAQRAASVALSDPDHVRRARRLIRTESEFLYGRISDMSGFECYVPAANFMLIRTRLQSKTIQRRLLRRGILVRDCSSFRGLDGHHIRIAVRTRRENERLIGAMSNI